jgi:hypothetical protein
MAFLRHVEVIVGPKGGTGITVTDLCIEFHVVKDNSPETNTAVIKLYNLSKEHATMVISAGNHLELKAGYEDETLATIFFGDVVTGKRYKNGTDWITELEAHDSRTALFSGMSSVSFAENTPASVIAQAFIDTIGLPVRGQDKIPTVLYTHGYSFIGFAKDGLNEVLARFGLRYTVQDEQLLILDSGNTVEKTAALALDAESGLLTIPQPITDAKETNDTTAEVPSGWTFTALLFPELLPGSVCSVSSATLNGDVVISTVTFTGNTMSGDFKAEVEAQVI